MYCKKCGNEVNDSAAFCKKCGYRFQTGDKPAEVQARASAKASVSPSPVKVKPAAAEAVSAGVKPRARVNKYFVIGLAAILVVVAAVVVIIRLATANEGKKIANAVQNTFEAKSYRAELELYNGSDKYGENYVLETYTKGDKKRMYAEKKINSKYSDFDRAYLYMPEKMGENFILAKNENGDYYKASPKYNVKAVNEFANRDLYKYLKKQGADKDMKKIVKCDYDEFLPIIKQMLVDYYSNPKDFKYMKKCEKKDNTYRFVIDFKEFINCANSDYDLIVKTKFLQKLYGKGPNKIKPEMVIKITIDGKYISKVESRINISGADVYSLKLNISDVNKVDYETKKTKSFLKQYNEVRKVELQKDVEEENDNAKKIYDKIVDTYGGNYFNNVDDFWSAQDREEENAKKNGTENDFKFTADKTYDIDNYKKIDDVGAKRVIALLENLNVAGIRNPVPSNYNLFTGEYRVLRVKESDKEKLVVQYRFNDSDSFGQYPEAVTADDFMDNSAVWGTYCPQN